MIKKLKRRNYNNQKNKRQEIDMLEKSDDIKEEVYYQRFEPFLRFMHLIVILSFISLAFTGMIIKFSGIGLFQILSQIMGGYEVTGFIHRVAAFFTLVYLVAHVGSLVTDSC